MPAVISHHSRGQHKERNAKGISEEQAGIFVGRHLFKDNLNDDRRDEDNEQEGGAQPAHLQLGDEHNGVARATVTTAVPLTDEQRTRVGELLGELVGAKVDTSEDVDAKIVGGIIARVGDHLIDGSVTTKLRNMQNALARPPAQVKQD